MTSSARMNRALVLKLAASTILMGSVLVSCSANSGANRPQSLSSKAEKALAKGKPEKALEAAEAAVLLDPRNLELRKRLANAYLANGRFSSARQSLDDALALGDQSARTVISLALMHVAQGRSTAAQALLRDYRDTLPAGDYGLAMALAGETRQGVDILIEQVRGGEDSVKVRQNLAFAYALDGRWREAQTMLGQDLEPAMAQARIAEWARMGHPEGHAERVATVLGVSPADYDPGQPVQLALSNTPSMADTATAIGQQAMAQAGSAELPPVEDSRMDMAMAQADFAPGQGYANTDPVVPNDSFAAAAMDAGQPSAAMLAPLVVAREIVQPLPGNYRATPVRKARPVQVASREMIIEREDFDRAVAPSAVKPSGAAAAAPAFAAANGGGFAIQLGVFSNAANANRAWAGYSAKHKDLAGFSKSADAANIKGRTLHRLMASGFGDEKSARAMCAKVRASGGDCIISHSASGKPRGATQVAARR